MAVPVYPPGNAVRFDPVFVFTQRQVVLKHDLLYIRIGVYLGCCEGDRQF